MNAPAPKKVWNQALIRSGYLVGAILFHLILFLLVATWVVFKAPERPATDVFHGVKIQQPPPPPPAPPPASGAAADNPQLEPQQLVAPAVTPPSIITSINSSFAVNAPKIDDQALSHANFPAPEGSGLSSGSGSSGTGGGDGYGSAAGSATALVGTLYDLKQTPDGQPTDIAENQVELGLPNRMDSAWLKSPATQRGLEVLRSFVRSWDEDTLGGYYKAPKPLYTSQIWVPLTPSVKAPAAFGVEGKVHARRWIVVYKGKIIPPMSGMFRFIGFGDDFLVVRVDGRNVLDGSLPNEELDPKANGNDSVGVGPEKQPLRCGKWVQMEAGTAMDMEVLIGEGPGGSSGFVLMIQEQGDNSPRGDYPVFQLQDGPIPDFGSGFTCSKKKMLFQASP